MATLPQRFRSVFAGLAAEPKKCLAWCHEAAGKVVAAIQKKDPRFDPVHEVDLKMANETLSYDPARWVDPGRPVVPLLLFPPTSQQLSLIGNNGK